MSGVLRNDERESSVGRAAGGSQGGVRRRARARKGRPSAALATAALPEDRTNDLTRRPNTQSEDATITVLIPEIVPSKRRHEIVHNQRGRLLEAVLKARTDGVVVATLPLHLHD